MTPSLLVFLLGVAFCQAAWFPRQAPAPAPAPVPAQPTPACVPQTVFLTVIHTITDTPSTVTIAQIDSSSIGRQLSSKASVDTVQVTQKDPLAPAIPSTVTVQPVPTTHLFTHDIVVPGFEATEAPNDGTDVYYVSAAKQTPPPGVPPTGLNSITIGATTVTVNPPPKSTLPPPGAGQPAQSRHLFPAGEGQWNGTSNSTVDAAGTGDAPVEPILTTSITSFVTTVTSEVTIEVSDAPSWSDFHETNLGGYGADGGSVTDSPEPSSSDSQSLDELQKRQTCTLVSASIGDRWVSWCNNWDGSTTVSYTSWETTTVPTYIPGIGPIEPAPTTSSSDSSATTSAPPAGATPVECGEVGPFRIDFDDLPEFSTSDPSPDDAPPIFSPYPTRKYFTWARGWSYAPPPGVPYPPHRGDRLAQYTPPGNNSDIGSPNSGLYSGAAFGAGPRAADDTYWFEAESLWVGCDNGATNPQIDCDFVATAYQWNEAQQKESVVATQHLHVPPCPNFENCRLSQMKLDSRFTSLSSLSFYAKVQGKIRGFWVDSLDLAWYNNTCDAGIARISPGKVKL